MAGVHVLIAVFCGTGLWLMLPRGGSGTRAIGSVIAAVGLGLLFWRMAPIGGWIQGGVFQLLAGVTIVAAAATITTRRPVHSAIWFGLSLLGVAGLFLMNGSQFLAVATIVVYAGAILVMFLFVLMLAQPWGATSCDRLSWEAMLSAFSAAILVAVLTMTVATVLSSPESVAWPQVATESQRLEGVLAEDHVASLGRLLFDRYLVAVEVAGVLLTAALVGTSAIVVRARSVEPVRPDRKQGEN